MQTHRRRNGGQRRINKDADIEMHIHRCIHTDAEAQTQRRSYRYAISKRHIRRHSDAGA